VNSFGERPLSVEASATPCHRVGVVTHVTILNCHGQIGMLQMDFVGGLEGPDHNSLTRLRVNGHLRLEAAGRPPRARNCSHHRPTDSARRRNLEGPARRATAERHLHQPSIVPHRSTTWDACPLGSQPSHCPSDAVAGPQNVIRPFNAKRVPRRICGSQALEGPYRAGGTV